MTTLIGAIALFIAAPASAQPAPVAAPDSHSPKHRDHRQQPHAGHAEHRKDCCKDAKHRECCAKSKQQGQTADCCAGHGKAGGHQGHSGH